MTSHSYESAALPPLEEARAVLYNITQEAPNVTTFDEFLRLMGGEVTDNEVSMAVALRSLIHHSPTQTRSRSGGLAVIGYYNGWNAYVDTRQRGIEQNTSFGRMPCLPKLLTSPRSQVGLVGGDPRYAVAIEKELMHDLKIYRARECDPSQIYGNPDSAHLTHHTERRGKEIIKVTNGEHAATLTTLAPEKLRNIMRITELSLATLLAATEEK